MANTSKNVEANPEPAPAKETPAKKPEGKEIPGDFSKAGSGMIEVETTGRFQLYNPFSGATIAAEGTTEVNENDPFVITHLKSKKLKKVK